MGKSDDSSPAPPAAEEPPKEGDPPDAKFGQLEPVIKGAERDFHSSDKLPNRILSAVLVECSITLGRFQQTKNPQMIARPLLTLLIGVFTFIMQWFALRYLVLHIVNRNKKAWIDVGVRMLGGSTTSMCVCADLSTK